MKDLMRMRPLAAIESYLSGAIAEGNHETDIAALCTRTYAYMSASEELREQLLTLFQAVYTSLRPFSQTKSSLFHKMQLGTRNAASLIDWVESMEGKVFLEDGCEDTLTLVQQFLKQNPGITATVNDEQLTAIIERWIDGDDLTQIAAIISETHSSTPRPPTILTKTEKIISGVVKFSFCHFISCVFDAVESNEDLETQHALNYLTAFQRKVKYGVPSLRAAAICEEVIDDRMIAKDILSIIGATGSSDINLIKYEAISNQAKVEQLASELPTYCSKRILDWIGI